MEDWDLQAIVKGSSREARTTDDIMETQPPYCFEPLLLLEDGYQFSDILFPDVLGITPSFDELEGLYKPSKPVLFSFSSQTIHSPSISFPREVKHGEKLPPPKAQTTASKYKTSKKSQKKNKVVKHVKEDGLFSDMWAWRKYGQKPIKGSPFPRSYYRCSSSKGCSARKQVQRNHSDPTIFIITYTSEHNHPHPTRRNSLAGTTRNKFPKSKMTDNNSSDHGIKPAVEPSTSTSPSLMEGELLQDVGVKKEEEATVEEREGYEAALPHIMYAEEAFPSLEELLFG